MARHARTTPVLLHTCCGPCSTYTVKRLREQSIEPTALWYNPNIHPFMEHNRRLESMQDFAHRAEVPLVVVEGFDFVRFLRLVSGHEGDRCADCYRLRLGRAAAEARQRGLSAFTTTLLISPYQDHEQLRQVGQEVAQEHEVEFYYEDLRPGFPESRRLSRELGLYRQQYCGCIYSEWERYAKAKIGSALTPSPFPAREGGRDLTPDPFPMREGEIRNSSPHVGERPGERAPRPHGIVVGQMQTALTPDPFPKREGELEHSSPRIGERPGERAVRPDAIVVGRQDAALTPGPFPKREGELEHSSPRVGERPGERDRRRGIIVGEKVDHAVLMRAKELRHEQTPAEHVLWQALRGNQLQGWHFRRQQAISGFIADFYCHAAGLVIEVDGPSHDGQVEYDRERESALAAHGLRILRFKNDEVLRDLPGVLARIGQQLDPTPSRARTQGSALTPSPFPKREGEERLSSPRVGERSGERAVRPDAIVVGRQDATLTPGPFPKREGEERLSSPRIGERSGERAEGGNNGQ